MNTQQSARIMQEFAAALHYEAELTMKEMDYLIDSTDEISPEEIGERLLPEYRRHRQSVITKTGMLTPDGYRVLTETRWEVFEELIEASNSLNRIVVTI